MKTTLILLLSLGSITIGADSVVFDFGRTDDDTFQTAGAISIGSGAGAYKSELTSEGSLGTLPGNYSFSQQRTSGGYNNSATLDVGAEGDSWKEHLYNVPSGWDSTFADGLTSQWDSGSQSGNTYTLTFTGLTQGYYDLSVLGGYHGKDNIVGSITLSLSGAGIDTSSTSWSSTDIGGAGTGSASGVSSYSQSLTDTLSGDEGYTYDISHILVGADGELTVSIVGNTANKSKRTPLNGLKLTMTEAIPEPSTGALSLLALAGLVFRRRR